MTLDFEPERGFGIYLHWPFCTHICPYCDFNVYAAKQRDVAPLIDALHADIVHWRKEAGPREVRSIFLGGGTPSLIHPDDVSRLIETISDAFGLEEACEITLEANPDDRDRFSGFAKAGVNRLSLGIQSLREDKLRFLGRQHSVADALDAVSRGRTLFPSLSLDFIYALPDQSLSDWEEELDQILSLDADHLSPYELTIEEKTPFGKAVGRGEWEPADDDISADLYELTQELTEDAGYLPYEISNHARGVEHQSKHNRIYWQSGDWLGIGPGAHGRVTLDRKRLAVIAAKRPDQYIEQILSGQDRPDWQVEHLSAQDVANERLIMGLRLLEGLPITDYTVLAQAPLNKGRLEDFIDDGLVDFNRGRLSLTPQGRLLADYVARSLVG